MKDDMISRQAALDALDKVAEMFPYRIPGKAKTYRQYNEAWSDAIDAAENALEALPSAQPTDRNGQERTGTDLISRQAALGALTCKFRITGKENAETVATVIDEFNNKIKALPSAQPELENKIRAIGYTGKEGRIYIGGRLFAVRELPQ